MFALEIDFHDGVSSPEVLLIRRPIALVGTSEFAHVVIDGAAANLAELRLYREIGGDFACQVDYRSQGNEQSVKTDSFEKFAKLELGEVTTSVTSLDFDLALKPDESLDSAGLRIAREALTSRAARFPALALLGARTVYISILPKTGVVLGRSRKSLIRLDAPDVSGEHARMGFEDDSFWIEDLGSTNGTFVEGEQISGRVNFSPGQKVRLGGETVIGGVASRQDFDLYRSLEEDDEVKTFPGKYPCLVSSSDLIKPARVPLVLGRTITLGRDPSNDIWVGASHISRNHCLVTFSDSGLVKVTDESSNGTFLGDSRLDGGVVTDVTSESSVINLGSELKLKVCFDRESEEAFLEEHSLPAIGQDETSIDGGLEHTSLKEQTVGLASGDEELEIEGDGVFARLARRRSGESQIVETPEVIDQYQETPPRGIEGNKGKSTRLITSAGLVLVILSLIAWIGFNLWKMI